MDLDALSPGLARGPDGAWHPPSRSPVSYPAGGNELCFGLEDASFWFRHRGAMILELVRSFPPSGPLFDVGGGNGYVCRLLGRAGTATVLVEPGADGVRNAISRGVDPVVMATLEDAGFRDGSLPAVGLFDVIEHVEDDRSFLARVRRLLAPGGTLYLTMPALPWLWSEEDALAGHHRRYRLADLDRKLRAAGFRPLFLSHMFLLLTLPVFLLRALPGLIGLPRGETLAGLRRQLAPDGPRARLAGALLELMRWELRRVRERRPVPFGTSLLAAARA